MLTCLILLVIAAIWITCGYLAHGYCLGFGTAQWPNMNHEPFATLWGYMGGPFSLMVVLIYTHGKHFLAKPLSKEEAWKHHQEMYPALKREWFEMFYK